MSTYFVANGPGPTTTAVPKVTTGTAIKTLLQVAPSSGNPIIILEWGISFDGTAPGTPIMCELIDTATVAATVTAHASSGVTPFLRVGDVGTSSVTLGTTATGYTATAEGTVTSTRLGDMQLVAPTNQYVKQYPLGREFFVAGGRIVRVRVTAAAAVNAWTYMIFQDM